MQNDSGKGTARWHACRSSAAAQGLAAATAAATLGTASELVLDVTSKPMLDGWVGGKAGFVSDVGFVSGVGGVAGVAGVGSVAASAAPDLVPDS